MSKRDTRRAKNYEPRIPRGAATQCTCGTWRTPGITHTKGDTGTSPGNPISGEWCTK